MGLDQYAYTASRAGTEYDDSDRRDLAYWRKHPNLQGWMQNLWESKGKPNQPDEHDDTRGTMFNGIELELTWQDIDCLEKDILDDQLSKLETTGFFFGHPSDEYYREHDLEFCRKAKADLFVGLKVFYNSSW